MFTLFALIRPCRVSVALVLVLALAQSLANLYLPRLSMAITAPLMALGGVIRTLLAAEGRYAALYRSPFAGRSRD